MGFHGRQRYTEIPEIRYGVVPAKEIANRALVPGKTTHGSLDVPDGWKSGNTPIGGRGLRPSTHRLRVEASYYLDFEADIKEHGFRNPALCWGFEGGTYVVYGTTRMYIARKLDLDIPVFIVDWSGKWRRLELIRDRDQALGKFSDAPADLAVEPDFFSFYNERNDYDPYEIKCRLQREAGLQTPEGTDVGRGWRPAQKGCA